MFSFRLRAGVEILSDNNASPVAPLISWKCNYEPGMGEARLRRSERNPAAERLSRREWWKERDCFSSLNCSDISKSVFRWTGWAVSTDEFYASLSRETSERDTLLSLSFVVTPND